MSYKLMTGLLAALAALSPIAGFSQDQTEITTLQSQISALDKQIDDLNKARNEESFEAALIRRNLYQGQGQGQTPQASQDAKQMQMHLDKANEIDQKIAQLEKQRADLQAKSAAARGSS